MTAAAFCLALLALLLSPGPTNTLLAIGGAERGLRAGLPLILAELSGYLLVVTPLALFGARFLAGHPGLALAVKLAAAGWVLFLAIRLWSPPAAAVDTRLATFRRVFLTTLLNPKGLVIGLAILPAVPFAALLPWLALFAIILVCVAALWIAGGAALGRSSAGRLPPLARRGASGYLGLVAIGLLVGSFG